MITFCPRCGGDQLEVTGKGKDDVLCLNPACDHLIVDGAHRWDDLSVERPGAHKSEPPADQPEAAPIATGTGYHPRAAERQEIASKREKIVQVLQRYGGGLGLGRLIQVAGFRHKPEPGDFDGFEEFVLVSGARGRGYRVELAGEKPEKAIDLETKVYLGHFPTEEAEPDPDPEPEACAADDGLSTVGKLYYAVKDDIVQRLADEVVQSLPDPDADALPDVLVPVMMGLRAELQRQEDIHLKAVAAQAASAFAIERLKAAIAALRPPSVPAGTSNGSSY